MSALSFEITQSAFAQSVVLRACHTCLGRFVVSLDEGAAGMWKITLKPKPGVSAEEAGQAEDDFRNALINEALRDSLMEHARNFKEMIVAQALFGVDPEPLPEGPAAAFSPEDLALDDKNLDFLADPLGIAVPWEEKFGKDDTSPRDRETHA